MIIRSLAARSPVSMRLASMTSSAAVSSLCRPAASMKSWSGSSVPDAAGAASAAVHRGADGHVALVERGLKGRDLVVGQIVLVGERLELPFLDETAVGGLLDEALGRRQIVQMRVSQWNLPLSVVGTAPFAAPRPRRGA